MVFKGMKNNRWNYLLILIVSLALFLRIYKLGQIPASINPDETALGYTSYSLLKTGADEHGRFFPLTLQSFGDWKLPVYSYIGIIPVGLFDLNEFSIRFPSMLAGVIAVVLVYFISLILFSKKGLALISALLFALSPWSIYFSRAAYEVNVATTLFLSGFLFYISYMYKKDKIESLFVSSSILFGLTLFTQHNYIIFTPLYVFLLFFIFRKKIIYNKAFFIGVIIFCIFILISYTSTVFGGSKKISNLNVFNDKNILYNRVEKLRGDKAPKNQFLERILHTKYLGVPYQIGQNYINSFSPVFLFDKGGEKLVHNIGDFGNFYLFDAFLLLVGFAALFWNKEKSLPILFGWLLISPIPSMVTRDTPNSTRLFTMVPVLLLIASYGAYHIFCFLSVSRKGRVVFGLLIFVFILNVVYFLDIYFVHFEHQRIRFWRYGYREAVQLTQNYPDYNVVMRGPENFPYIYFLFYDKYDPRKFREEVMYYPTTSEGFYFVKKFGRYNFVDSIDYSKTQSKTIYIDDTRLDDKDHSINLPSGEPVLGYFIKK